MTIGKEVIWIDFQSKSNNIPPEAYAEIRQMWRDYELSNDTSFTTWDHEEMKDDFPAIAEMIAVNGLIDKDVYLHWWW